MWYADSVVALPAVFDVAGVTDYELFDQGRGSQNINI